MIFDKALGAFCVIEGEKTEARAKGASLVVVESDEVEGSIPRGLAGWSREPTGSGPDGTGGNRASC